MISRVWKKLLVKLEVRDTAAVGVMVRSDVVVGARKFGTQLAFATGGRGVQKGPTASVRGAPVEKPVAGGIGCYGCRKVGHVQRDCHVR